MEEFVRRSHSLGNNIHHFEWCTKYRYNMFRKTKHAEFCKDAINMAARKYGIEIIELAVMPDHIHIVAQIPAEMSQSKAIQLLKGASSHELFRTVPAFRLRYPKGNLWSKGNFKDSVGRITAEAAQKYVREQQLGLESFTRNCGL
jgi:putative transposase